MALNTNLVAYWKLDESSGNATDVIASAVLTNNGTITYSAGKINNGSDFSSSNGSKYFTTADGAYLDFSTAFSISLWFKCTGGAGTYRHLITKPSSPTWVSPFFRYGLRITNGNELETWADTSAGGTATTSTSGSFGADSTWKHAVVVFNQTTIKIYVNGSESASASNTSPVTNSSQSLVLGNRHDGDSGEYFSGMVDEVGLWSRALNSTEIGQLYNFGNGNQYPFVEYGGSFLLNFI